MYAFIYLLIFYLQFQFWNNPIFAQPPKPGLKTEDWLQKVSEKLHQNVAMNRQQRQQEEQKMGIVKSKLRELVTSVKQLLSGHSRLLSDVKTLLKTMAKVCFEI